MMPTSDPKVIQFPVGGLGEDETWEIHLDATQRDTNGFFRPFGFCRHCHSPRLETLGTHPGAIAYPAVTCPRVVVARNQGGHDCTAVCLDCILEAAAGLPPVGDPAASPPP